MAEETFTDGLNWAIQFAENYGRGIRASGMDIVDTQKCSAILDSLVECFREKILLTREESDD